MMNWEAKNILCLAFGWASHGTDGVTVDFADPLFLNAAIFKSDIIPSFTIVYCHLLETGVVDVTLHAVSPALPTRSVNVAVIIVIRVVTIYFPLAKV